MRWVVVCSTTTPGCFRVRPRPRPLSNASRIGPSKRPVSSGTAGGKEMDWRPSPKSKNSSLEFATRFAFVWAIRPVVDGSSIGGTSLRATRRDISYWPKSSARPTSGGQDHDVHHPGLHRRSMADMVHGEHTTVVCADSPVPIWPSCPRPPA